MIIDHRPLSPLAANNRGQSERIGPKDDRPVFVVECLRENARAEYMGIVLGICAPRNTPKSCAPTGPDRFLMPAVRAHLRWGAGSVSFQAECDWMQGTQIGVIAETIRVCAAYKIWSPPWEGCPDICDPCLPEFDVQAAFGYGARNYNSNSARLTEMVQIESPGEKVRVPVPAYALSFSVLPFGGNHVSLDVLGLCGGYRVPYIVQSPLTNIGQHNVENSFPLFNGARFLEFTNVNASGPLFAAVVFGLAL